MLNLGPIGITFHRTVRVAADKVSNLPPSLGHFETYKVSDYRSTCPDTWEDNAIFIALHDKEAMWMSFRSTGPVALLIGAGGINALTGEKLGTKLEKDNYLVTPPQPWLDGWKDKDGTVYQFVTTEYKQGEGLTVGEQLIGKESKSGGLGIAVFEPKNVGSLKIVSKPGEVWGGSQFEAPIKTSGGISLCCNEPAGALRLIRAAEMGVGKGGKIHQKVYPDPHGLEVWKESPTVALAVYLINAQQFAEITDKTMPPSPVDYSIYQGIWYGLQDQQMSDVQGTDKFSGLKSVFVGEIENVKEQVS